MAQELESKALRFPFAGNLTLIRRAADGTDSKDPKDTYTSGRNVYGAITSTYSVTTENLEDENSKYPAAIYITGTNSTLAVVFRTEDPDLDRFVKGSIKAEETNIGMWHSNLSVTIGQDGTAKLLDLEGNPVKINEDAPVLVRDFMTNADYTEASSATPAAGEYSVDPATGIFTFHTDDAGKKVFISCELIAAEAISFSDSTQPSSQTMRAIVSGPASDYTETNPLWVTLDADAIQLSGDYSPLARQKSGAEKTLSLQTTRPRGDVAIKTTYSKRLVDTTKE